MKVNVAILKKDNKTYKLYASDIEDKFNVPRTVVWDNLKKYGFYGSYKGYVIQEEKPLKNSKKKKPATERKEPVLDYLLEHLRIYGNTCLKRNPEKYVPMLKEKGIEVKITHIPKPKPNRRSFEQAFGNYYLIERTNK